MGLHEINESFDMTGKAINVDASVTALLILIRDGNAVNYPLHPVLIGEVINVGTSLTAPLISVYH